MSDMSKREFETVLAYFQAKIVCSDMNGAPCIHKTGKFIVGYHLKLYF